MKTLKKSIKILLILIFLISPLYFNINLMKLKSKGINEDKIEFLRSTDIAGTDLYSEQI